MSDFAEIDVATGRLIQVKFGGSEPAWPAGRRGVVLNPDNPNHAIDLTLPGHCTAAGDVFTLHPPPPAD